MQKRSSTWSQIGAVASACLLGITALVPGKIASAFYVQTNLVSDIPGLARFTDPNLVNPWGMSASPMSPIWVSDNHSGVATLYNGAGVPQPQPTPLIVTIPPPAGSPPGTISAPTGQVFNSSATSFGGSHFIFATEDGTIAAWTSGTSAVLEFQSPSGAIYKGLAIGNNGSGNFLYATDFHNNAIDVFDSNFAPATLSGHFTDPNLLAGFAPFNIQHLGSNLYVTYAKQDNPLDAPDDVAGLGNGFVDVFDLNGAFVKRLISDGSLNSPWGSPYRPPTSASTATICSSAISVTD